MSEFNNLSRLPEDQVGAASKVVARAIQDDPLFIYCFPDPIERKIKSVMHCEWLILLGILTGEVYITSSGIEGVAVWHAYAIKDKKIGKQSKEIISRLRKIKREVFSDPLTLERMSIVEEFANSFQNEHVNFPHWYLSIIGVAPIHQGKGYASMLIRAKLREIDKQNLHCYLHTENGKNVQIYEHFGFELVGKTKVPNSNFYFHGMLRKKKM